MGPSLKNLIEVLTILSKYGDPVLHSDWNEIFIEVDPALVNENDLKRLSELGAVARTNYERQFIFYLEN
jgi:hypothetical protein